MSQNQIQIELVAPWQHTRVQGQSRFVALIPYFDEGSRKLGLWRYEIDAIDGADAIQQAQALREDERAMWRAFFRYEYKPGLSGWDVINLDGFPKPVTKAGFIVEQCPVVIPAAAIL